MRKLKSDNKFILKSSILMLVTQNMCWSQVGVRVHPSIFRALRLLPLNFKLFDMKNSNSVCPICSKKMQSNNLKRHYDTKHR